MYRKMAATILIGGFLLVRAASTESRGLVASMFAGAPTPTPTVIVQPTTLWSSSTESNVVVLRARVTVLAPASTSTHSLER